MNLAQGSVWQVSQTGVDGWDYFDAKRLDGMGTVISLKTGEKANKMLVPPEGAYGAGVVRVRCTWQGHGVLNPQGIASSVSMGTNSFEFDWTAGTTALPVWIELSKTDQTDPLRRIDCREKSASPTALFSPDFLESLKGYKLVRFMDWQNTNANVPQTWATRTLPDAQSQTTKLGVAVEYMVALANEAGVDPWFSMPWNADEDYIRRFATYVHDNLAPGRVVYVELGNEVWNSIFPVTSQAQTEGVETGLSPNANLAMLLRYAQKSTWMHKIWTDVYKANPGQLVRIVSTQNGSQWATEQVLKYGDTAQYVDALATAPYFGYATFAGDRAQITDLSDIFTYLSADIDRSIEDAIKNKQLASRYGKRYIAYEGGQHVVNPGNVELVAKINRDPRMYDLYKKYISVWNLKINDTMTLFASTSPISQYGAWGLREYAGQPLAETPKRRAAIDYMNAAY